MIGARYVRAKNVTVNLRGAQNPKWYYWCEARNQWKFLLD